MRGTDRKRKEPAKDQYGFELDYWTRPGIGGYRFLPSSALLFDAMCAYLTAACVFALYLAGMSGYEWLFEGGLEERKEPNDGEENG